MDYFLAIFCFALVAAGGYLLLADTYIKKWRNLRHIVCSIFLSSFAAGHFESIAYVSVFYSVLILSGFLAMPLLLRFNGKRPILGQFVLREMSFSFSFCSFAILVQILMRWFLPRGLSDLTVTLLQALYLVISLIYIAYYMLDEDILSTESYVALYQTNAREAKNFLKDSLSIGKGLSICAAVLSLPALLYFLNAALEVKPKGTLEEVIIFSLLLLVALSNAKKTFTNSYFCSMIKESKDYLKNLRAWRSKKSNIDFTATLQQKAKGKDSVFVLVIGESETRDHMGVYGYGRETTPWLSEMNSEGNLLLFRNAYSCHVLTELVLSKALTESSQYREKNFEDSLSIIDIAKKAGLKTYYLSNQAKHSIFGNSSTLIAGEADTKIWIKDETKAVKTYDEELLPEFARFKEESGDKLFVIHLAGSHFEYRDRYPARFQAFDKRRDNCTEGVKRPEKVCQYDNSILYTDYILSEIYHIATQDYAADGIIYFSDHGEAVKRDKKHLPGMFDFDMARIPFWISVSEDYRRRNKELAERLESRRNSYFTNDMIYDTLLGIMNIETDRYTARQDFSSPEYDFTQEDLLTMHGEVRLKDERKRRCSGNLTSIAAN